jgi:hypothetical protein
MEARGHNMFKLKSSMAEMRYALPVAAGERILTGDRERAE